jgi:putative ABC transport system ATP-binding protein
LLARAIVSRPRLLVIDGLVDLLPRDARRKVTENLLDPQRGWTLVLVSDDPELAASCSHVLELPTGLLRVNETKRPAGAV